MNLFPFVNIEEVEVIKEELPLYTEIAWDFENDKPIVENGEFKIVTGNEAIKVWAYKAVLTNRFEYDIYSWDYGSEVYSLIGKNYTNALTESEFKRYIEECLYTNPYITEVVVNKVTYKDGLLHSTIVLKTIYEGEVKISV